MDLESRKISFVQEFLNLQNEEVVAIFEKLLKQERSKSIDEIFTPLSKKEFNERIDKSMDDSNNDKVISTDELLTEIKEWN